MYKERKKLAKKTFGNFPFLSVIFSVSLSLLLLGIFSLFLISSIEVRKVIQENTEVNIFLNKNISSNQVDKIKRTLFTKDYILSKDETTLKYISSSDAAEEFSKEIGEDFVNFLGSNPLRDLIILKIRSDFFEKESLENIESDILKVPGVYEVDYSKEMIENINSNLPQPVFEIIYNTRKVLIPIHEDLIKEIDKKNNIIYLDIPDGLLEII